MGERKASLTVRNDPGEMLRVSAWLEETAESIALPAGLLFRLDLVLNEALPNIMAYAFPEPGMHEIDIALLDGPDELCLQITDDGIPFDPLARQACAEAASLESAAVGGRGIHLIRSFTDSQAYTRHDGRNRLSLGFRKAADANARASARD